MLRVPVDFEWHPGFAESQKRKNVAALHQAALNKLGIASILEVSTKSEHWLGNRLSAFNLGIELDDGAVTSLEAVFQGSKRFADGGPFTDLYLMSPREARREPRLQTSGPLIAFEFAGVEWPLDPPTAFYDWLYLKALARLDDEPDQLLEFEAFTDIEFNPQRSINCQAASCALYLVLRREGLLPDVLRNPAEFQATLTPLQGPEQQSLLDDTY